MARKKAVRDGARSCRKILAPLREVDFPYENDCQPVSNRGEENTFRLVFSGLPEKAAHEIVFRVASSFGDPDLAQLFQPLAEAQEKNRSEN